MRRRASLFAGLLVVGAVTAGVSAGVVGFLSSSATAGVRDVLAAMPASDLSLGIAMPLDPDATQQDRVARNAVRTTFRDGTRSILIDIESAVETVVDVATLRTRSDQGSSTRRVGIATASHLESDADLVSGRWGAGPGEATLQADAAAALGVALGDTLSIGDLDVTLVGTWRVADPEAARWMADERWTTGVSGSTAGQLVIDPAAWSAVGGTPWVHWAIMPDLARLHAADLAAIETAWSRTPDALKAAGLVPGSRFGQFLVATQDVRGRLAALQTAVPLALVILAVIAALTIWEFAGLIARTRATEMSLLWSRGSTTLALSASAAAEAGAVTAIGCVAGIGAAALTLWAARGAEAAASVVSAGVWAGAAVVVVSAAAFAARTARTANAGTAAERAGRVRRFAGVGAVVLLVVAAALSTWQLLTYGPVTQTVFGGASVDPLTVVAPALILASVVLLGLYAFPPLAAIVERAAIRTDGSALAVRGVARRIGAAGAAIVVIGLAVGQLAFAAGYGATWSESFAQTQELRAGTALRLEGPASGIADADLARAASAKGVVGVAPVRTASLSIGGEPIDLVGVASPAVATLAADGGRLIDPRALAAAVSPMTPLPLLPEGATTVTVDVGDSPAIATSVWLSDAWGRLQSVPLTSAGAGVSTAAVPDEGRAPWHLAAVDLTPAATPTAGPIEVASLTTDAGDVDPLPSVSVAFDENGKALPTGDGTGAMNPGPDGLVRLLPAAGVSTVAVPEWLAERTGVTVGSPITLDLSADAPSVVAAVAAIVPAIPGSQGSSTILIDASVIDAAALRGSLAPDASSTVWVGSNDPDASAQALREALGSSIAVHQLGAEPDRVMLSAGATSLWIAAVTGAILAIAGLIAVCAAQQRERRAEVGTLRALGLGAGGQAGVRRRELTLVTVWGGVCGLVAGAVSLLVVVATLARAAVPGAYPSIPTPPRLDLLTGGAALLAFAIAVAIVIVLAGAVVARTARSATSRLGDA